jgi:hypothetical protein
MEELKYPPTRLKSNSHEITNYKYGNGLYEVETWNNHGNAYYLFDGVSNRYPYLIEIGPYPINNISTLVKGSKIVGFWIEIRLPIKIKLSKYNICIPTPPDNKNGNYPCEITILGKNEYEWNVCNVQDIACSLHMNEFGWWMFSNKTFLVDCEEYFHTFRIVFGGACGSGTRSYNVSEIEFFGYEYNSDVTNDDKIVLLERQVEILRNEIKNLQFIIGLNGLSSVKNEIKEEVKNEIQSDTKEEDTNIDLFDNMNTNNNINDEDLFDSFKRNNK